MLVCFGSPLLDVVVKVNKSFLDKHNLTENGTTSIGKPQDLHENLLKDIEKLQPVFQAGGSVTNTARILQLYSESRGIVTYVGAIGHDFYGQMIKESLHEDGIDYNFVDVEETTGKCFVLLTGNSRTLVTDLGASKHFSQRDLTEKLWTKITHCDYLYLSAFFVLVSFDVVRKVMHYFGDTNKCIIINLGAPFLCERNPQEVIFMFRNADLVFGNENEFSALARILKIVDNNSNEFMLKMNDVFQNKSDRVLVLTRGHRSVFVAKNRKVYEYFVEPLVEGKVNSNGAGDAFVGGFLAKFLQNHSLSDCTNFGIFVAKKNLIQNFYKNTQN